MTGLRCALAAALCCAAFSGGAVAGGAADFPAAPPHPRDAAADALEARVAAILAGMTLEQKVGQMTQAEIRSVTPADITRYYLGSVLNGGGAWPGNDPHAPVSAWLALAERYRAASMATDMKVKVPLIWGIDAVHGNNNVFGATLFPHNIGLGATHDAALAQEIGRATARAVHATGIDWTFAPTLAVARDARWGRTYESYSEDPALAAMLGAAVVRGLQGDGAGGLASPGAVLATAKHFMGDGGTEAGHDQGVTRASAAQLAALHAQGYVAALGAGAQTVMSSFSSWNDPVAGIDHGKMHGSHLMLTEVLKERMGFDGFVVSDWNGIEQLPGCSASSCPQAIRAGIDMVMVPDAWKAFIRHTVAQVRSGEIPQARIDDAVSRILRVKLRAGLFDRTPSQGLDAGQAEALQARALARRAVRESLVLLKNQGAVLPLARGKRLLVVGRGADSLPMQCGGWSLTWQGRDTTNADFPAGQTVLAALREAMGADHVTWRERATGEDVAHYDAVVAVLGETPYAEGEGDIRSPATLSHSSRFPQDLALLKAVSGHGVPVATVLLSGRAPWTGDLLALSDAFVAAWLPGTEGGGIADLLLRDARGGIAHDFRGRLSFAWPGTPDAAGTPLFPLGYGLSVAHD